MSAKTPASNMQKMIWKKNKELEKLSPQERLLLMEKRNYITMTTKVLVMHTGRTVIDTLFVDNLKCDKKEFDEVIDLKQKNINKNVKPSQQVERLFSKELKLNDPKWVDEEIIFGIEIIESLGEVGIMWSIYDSKGRKYGNVIKIKSEELEGFLADIKGIDLVIKSKINYAILDLVMGQLEERAIKDNILIRNFLNIEPPKKVKKNAIRDLRAYIVDNLNAFGIERNIIPYNPRRSHGKGGVGPDILTINKEAIDNDVIKLEARRVGVPENYSYAYNKSGFVKNLYKRGCYHLANSMSNNRDNLFRSFLKLNRDENSYIQYQFNLLGGDDVADAKLKLYGYGKKEKLSQKDRMLITGNGWESRELALVVYEDANIVFENENKTIQEDSIGIKINENMRIKNNKLL